MDVAELPGGVVVPVDVSGVAVSNDGRVVVACVVVAIGGVEVVEVEGTARSSTIFCTSVQVVTLTLTILSPDSPGRSEVAPSFRCLNSRRAVSPIILLALAGSRTPR